MCEAILDEYQRWDDDQVSVATERTGSTLGQLIYHNEKAAE